MGIKPFSTTDSRSGLTTCFYINPIKKGFNRLPTLTFKSIKMLIYSLFKKDREDKSSYRQTMSYLILLKVSVGNLLNPFLIGLM